MQRIACFGGFSSMWMRTVCLVEVEVVLLEVFSRNSRNGCIFHKRFESDINIMINDTAEKSRRWKKCTR